MKSVYGWPGARAGVRYVMTKFSRMDSLPNFVTHGAPLRALRARESSAIKFLGKDAIFLFGSNDIDRTCFHDVIQRVT